MLFSISSFGLLALLLIAQTRPATSDFVCNDRAAVKNATEGYCLRAVDPKADEKNPNVHHLADTTSLLMPATWIKKSVRFPGSGIFTCANVKIFNAPTEKRYCCDIPSIKKKDGLGLTDMELEKRCVSRDEKLPSAKSTP